MIMIKQRIYFVCGIVIRKGMAVMQDVKGRQERLVFVDPEDEDISYWWPAIVVPEEEYELFKETMDNDAGVNVGEHERLVCYFEDGSFSVVPKSGLIPFNPQREPYKSYSTRLKHFLTDAGVRRATQFHNEGKIPKMFKWLILGETGYLDPTTDAEGEDFIETVDDMVVEEGETLADKTSTQAKVKKQQHQTTIKPAKEAKKRGRKPKNLQIPASVMSPKPVNPSDLMKIDALISASMSGNDPISSTVTESATLIQQESRMALNQDSITTTSSQ